MSEAVSSSPEETANFLEKIGHPVLRQRIIEVFPVSFPERRVLRVRDDSNEGSRVLKVRPDDAEAQEEVEKLKPLLASYRFAGAHFRYLQTQHLFVSGYLVINMPYLGRDLIKLGTDLDMLNLGQVEPNEVTFRGFPNDQIRKLVDNLQRAHISFAQKYGLIHGDVIQERAPNNVVYHDALNKLFLVDAEALAQTDETTTNRFLQQLSGVEEWMCENLLVESAHGK